MLLTGLSGTLYVLLCFKVSLSVTRCSASIQYVYNNIFSPKIKSLGVRLFSIGLDCNSSNYIKISLLRISKYILMEYFLWNQWW